MLRETKARTLLNPVLRSEFLSMKKTRKKDQIRQRNKDQGASKEFALHVSVSNNDFNNVEDLLKNGADIHKLTPKGKTALHFAAANNLIKMADLLLEKGSSRDINIQEVDQKFSPLHWGVLKSNATLVEKFLQAGAMVNLQTRNGNTALHFAANMGDLSKMEVLLKHGADVEKALNKKGQTPLFNAIRSGKYSAVKLLIDNGANVSIKDFNGDYPIHIAVQYEDIEVIDLLLEHGAKLDVSNYEGTTPFHIAGWFGSLNLKRHLQEKAPEIAKRDLKQPPKLPKDKNLNR